MGDADDAIPDALPEERSRITSLLASTHKYRALAVCAPAGSGKTTAVRHYVTRSAGTADYVAFSAATTRESLDEVLSVERGAWEMVIDDFDKAPPDIVEALVQHVRHDAGGKRFILVGRSRSAMRAHALLATGTAASLDAATLAFDDNEVAELARRLGAAYDDESVVQLVHDTDGWAIAVAWLVRDAAEAGRPLRGALETWREHRGHILLEFLGAEYEREATAFAAFKALLRDGSFSAASDLERFEALGFPVARTRAAVRPYRILSYLTRRADETSEYAASGAPLLTFSVLGRFRCQLAGNNVAFVRRRDRNVFAYVALAPEGRVTRDQLLSAFWSDTNRALATQGLRTTLSRIRSALGQVVGADAVEQYFYSADDVRVVFKHLNFDVRRFNEHFERGRMEDAREDAAAARYHYAAALRLYRDRLLASEPIEPCFLPLRGELDEKYAETLERLVTLYAADANYEAARSCSAKLAERARHGKAATTTGAQFETVRSTSA